jgi:tRNA threonylcarbamoyladenosine biosynthesis protein TsaE
VNEHGKPAKSAASGTASEHSAPREFDDLEKNYDAAPESEFSQEVITSSPEATFELGRRIARSLTGAVTILVSGDLGAGKTVFAKGIAAGLGIDPADVTSPSFTLINVHTGRLKLYHIDLYRLEISGCAGLGLEEIFEDPQGVVVIEWAERLPWLPQPAVRVKIEYADDNSRRILISGAVQREAI